MNPHLPLLSSPILTAASPSSNASTSSNMGLMTILPCLSMNPHFPVFSSPILTEANPSWKSPTSSNCGIITICPNLLSSFVAGLSPDDALHPQRKQKKRSVTRYCKVFMRSTVHDSCCFDKKLYFRNTPFLSISWYIRHVSQQLKQFQLPEIFGHNNGSFPSCHTAFNPERDGWFFMLTHMQYWETNHISISINFLHHIFIPGLLEISSLNFFSISPSFFYPSARSALDISRQ